MSNLDLEAQELINSLPEEYRLTAEHIYIKGKREGLRAAREIINS